MIGTAIIIGALIIAGALDDEYTGNFVEKAVFWVILGAVFLGDVLVA